VGLSILAAGDGRCEYGIEEESVYIINAVLIAVMVYYLSLKICLHFVFQRELCVSVGRTSRFMLYRGTFNLYRCIRKITKSGY